ncbi:lactosylceramide 4-alpha-galactosyltransferase [Drosophila grimshawi]|uniref:GH13059 n=1 Tax=Drosophila grimshawi TaxID=7222 RepID=B4JR55_DROGR|nr:lactosylceramide 4-alpha-galactosyltransferase [Drosophila grimshawi]EDV99385.1 GH13059 [Drosophila grimshawi]
MLLRVPLLLARFLHNSRLRLIFLALIVLLVGGILLSYRWQTDVQLCFMDSNQTDTTLATASAMSVLQLPRILDNVLLTDPKPIPGRSIFFHETSCHRPKRRRQRPGQRPNTQYNMLQLTARQACAIESAALHNPNFQVFVLFAGPTYRYHGNSSIGQRHQPIIDAILSYKNIQLRQLNLWSYAAGTPIEEWLKDGQLFRSSYLFSHISDFLRFLTLYRYGGIYLDMDVVMLRSMEDVPPNFTGAESNTHLAAGVMSLAPTGFGHEIAEACLRDFQQNFDGSDWGNNGPGVITRVAQHICGTKDISLMLEDRKRCLGFKVFERNAFYAVPWKHWRHFFEPQLLEQTLAHTKDSYLVHVWNKHSKQLAIKVGSSTAYGKYAEQHCPKSYAAAGEYF